MLVRKSVNISGTEIVITGKVINAYELHYLVAFVHDGIEFMGMWKSADVEVVPECEVCKAVLTDENRSEDTERCISCKRESDVEHEGFERLVYS